MNHNQNEHSRVLSEDRQDPFARIDTSRTQRRGFPEAVFCPGKTSFQIAEILKHQKDAGETPVLATRVTSEQACYVLEHIPEVKYFESARMLAYGDPTPTVHQGVVQVLCAGTADIPIAEEAALVAEYYGNCVQRVYDVGVAGIHRLLSQIEEIRKANVLIVVAGMEGALTSVVSGLTHQVVIAVPTSVGYGANFQGLSALLSMLNTCSPGVATVNIDNGFGAGCLASMINRKMA